MKNNDFILTARNLKKIYIRGNEKIAAVNDISLRIKSGEFVSFVGPSGSGKTTLVNILGCLDNPTSGTLNANNREIFSNNRALSERELTRIRREIFGYIFQNFYLIPTLTVYENIILPFSFYKKNGRKDNIEKLISFLGLEKRKDHFPNQLSGGEMQRVAIARALVNKPEILLADEPTGNLDTKRSSEIGKLLNNLNTKEKITIIMVTHNPQLAGMAHRTIELRDGKISKR